MPATVRRAAALVAAAALAVTLAGCSNTSTPAQKRPHDGTGTATAATDGVQQVTVTTGNDLRFHPATLEVHPGKVRIVLKNTAAPGSGPPHNLRIMGLPGQVPTVATGDTAEYVFTAPSPGRYTFVCTFHVAQGQTGTLVVTQ